MDLPIPEKEVESASQFSDLHPTDLLERILADGGAHRTFENIYRVSDSGYYTRDAFLCTALEHAGQDICNRDSYLMQKQATYEIDEWSTSCWNDLKKAQGLLLLKEKHADSPAILVGDILPESGYSILTTERISIEALPAKKRKKKQHHIDWWITENQDVSIYFKKLEV